VKKKGKDPFIEIMKLVREAAGVVASLPESQIFQVRLSAHINMLVVIIVCSPTEFSETSVRLAEIRDDLECDAVNKIITHDFICRIDTLIKVEIRKQSLRIKA